jgi:hypothetical protein
MKRLIDIFDDPSDLIIELNNRSIYNDPILGSDGYYHYIYCWINLDTQWCYVGAHSSVNPTNEERYLGSCGNPHYWNSIAQHQFTCLILGYTSDEDSLYDLEAKIIDQELLNKFGHNGIYNLTCGGKGSWTHCHTDEVKAKIRESNLLAGKGVYPFNTEEALLKSRIAHELKYKGDRCGQLHTKEARRKATDTQYAKYGRLGCHTEGTWQKVGNTRSFKAIERAFEYYNKNNIKITPEVYLYNSIYGNGVKRHIMTILSKYDSMKSDSRWIPEYTELFDHYGVKDNKIFIK